MFRDPLLLSFEYLTGFGVVCLYLALAIPVLWLGARSMSGLDPIRKWIAVGLRLDLLLFIVLIIAGAQYVREAKDLTVIAIRDVSGSTASVRIAGESSVHAAIGSYVHDQASVKPPDDRLGVVTFDESARIETFPQAASARKASAAIVEPAAGTDVAEAINLALAALPRDTLGRLVLFWDGNATTGDLDAALSAAAAQRVPIDVVPLKYAIDKEVALDRLIAPTSKNEREPFTVEVMIRSQSVAPVTAKLTVTDNGMPMDLDERTPGVQGTRGITLRPGMNVERVFVPPSLGGVHQFRAHVDAEPSADTLPANNTAEAVTIVRGRGRILYVHSDSHSGPQPLLDALRRHEMVSDDAVISASAFPRSLVALQQYDAIVLTNVQNGLAGLDREQDAMLARYVHELGGGLVMVGGPDAFGAGGWIGSEVEKILPVECQPPAHRIMPAGALVLVIDHSGSMSGSVGGALRTKQEVANEAAVLAAETLARGDWLGVIAFDAIPTWVIPLGNTIATDSTKSAIRSIRPAGGTNIYPALDEALAALAAMPREQVRVKHVILLTDGQSERGDDSRIAEQLNQAGITLSTVAIGDDADRALLNRLAELAGGRFYDVRDANVLPRVFIKEALTLRRTLIREEPFMPHLADAGSPIVAGIDSLIVLRGMVATWAKQSPHVNIIISTEGGEPVLAYWNTGLGRAAVFTSDDGSRWATDWAGSTMFDKLWSQVVRAVSRASGSALADGRIVRTAEGRARIEVEALGADGRFKNWRVATASILGPDPRQPAKLVPLRQTGAGLYSADIETTMPGTYAGIVKLLDESGGSIWLPIAHVVDASPELRDLASNDAAVMHVAARTGGRVLQPFDRSASFFERGNLARRFTSRPLTEPLLYAALVTLLLDVATRRIAWDRHSFHAAGVAFAGLVRSRTQVRTGDARPSLTALRSVRQTVVERFDAQRESTDAISGTVREPSLPSPNREVAAEDAPSTPADPIARIAEAKRRARENRD